MFLGFDESSTFSLQEAVRPERFVFVVDTIFNSQSSLLFSIDFFYMIFPRLMAKSLGVETSAVPSLCLYSIDLSEHQTKKEARWKLEIFLF